MTWTAAGLMLSSVVKLSRVRPGFDADHLLTFKVALTGSNYLAAPTRTGFASEIVAQTRSTRGALTPRQCALADGPQR